MRDRNSLEKPSVKNEFQLNCFVSRPIRHRHSIMASRRNHAFFLQPMVREEDPIIIVRIRSNSKEDNYELQLDVIWMWKKPNEIEKTRAKIVATVCVMRWF